MISTGRKDVKTKQQLTSAMAHMSGPPAPTRMSEGQPDVRGPFAKRPHTGRKSALCTWHGVENSTGLLG
eukprot:9086591-Pyramimonas_sp.AAC.1